MLRLVYIVTHPMTARYLLRGQLEFFRKKGFDVYLICSPGEDATIAAEREGITLLPVPVNREISIFQDIVSLVRLHRIIRKIQPDIVNAGTPKAGLLGMLAATIARVPLRIYTLRGLRLETKKGFNRFILSLTERIASACAHQVVCVSESLKQKYLELGLTQKSKALVIGPGSSNGVDVQRFENQHSSLEVETLKKNLDIPADAPVIGFIGRLTRDKGIEELLKAFQELLLTNPNVFLLIIGDFESGDPLPQDLIIQVKQHPQIKHLGFASDPSVYYRMMDIFAFPSHREGFPNAPLEAAASGVPTVGFNVTGTIDAVINGVTGSLVPFRDTKRFANAISEYFSNKSQRTKHASAAHSRVVADFQQEKIWNGLYETYMNLLHHNGKISEQVDSVTCKPSNDERI